MVVPLPGSAVAMAGVVFGKLPTHGDFVSRGLRADERDMLDIWLSAAMLTARETWADSFEDRYDRALPLRCDGLGMSGALAASQDSAGRRYPLLAFGGAGEGERIEALLYDAIAQAWTADRLADALTPPTGAAERWYRDEGPIVPGQAPADLLVEMLR